MPFDIREYVNKNYPPEGNKDEKFDVRKGYEDWKAKQTAGLQQQTGTQVYSPQKVIQDYLNRQYGALRTKGLNQQYNALLNKGQNTTGTGTPAQGTEAQTTQAPETKTDTVMTPEEQQEWADIMAMYGVDVNGKGTTPEPTVTTTPGGTLGPKATTAPAGATTPRGTTGPTTTPAPTGTKLPGTKSTEQPGTPRATQAPVSPTATPAPTTTQGAKGTTGPKGTPAATGAVQGPPLPPAETGKTEYDLALERFMGEGIRENNEDALMNAFMATHMPSGDEAGKAAAQEAVDKAFEDALGGTSPEKATDEQLRTAIEKAQAVAEGLGYKTIGTQVLTPEEYADEKSLMDPSNWGDMEGAGGENESWNPWAENAKSRQRRLTDGLLISKYGDPEIVGAYGIYYTGADQAEDLLKELKMKPFHVKTEEELQPIYERAKDLLDRYGIEINWDQKEGYLLVDLNTALGDIYHHRTAKQQDAKQQLGKYAEDKNEITDEKKNAARNAYYDEQNHARDLLLRSNRQLRSKEWRDQVNALAEATGYTKQNGEIDWLDTETTGQQLDELLQYALGAKTETRTTMEDLENPLTWDEIHDYERASQKVAEREAAAEERKHDWEGRVQAIMDEVSGKEDFDVMKIYWGPKKPTQGKGLNYGFSSTYVAGDMMPGAGAYGSVQINPLQGITDIGELEYVYANDPELRAVIRSNEFARTGDLVDPYATRGYASLTEDELDTFNYLWNSPEYGPQAAKDFVEKTLGHFLMSRYASEYATWLTDMSVGNEKEGIEGDPVGASLLTLVLNVTSALEAPGAVLAAVFGSDVDDEYTVRLLTQSSLARDTIRAAVGASIDDIADGLLTFGYNAGMSMLDNLIMMAMTGGSAGGGTKFQEVMVQIMMSGAAASGTLSQMVNRDDIDLRTAGVLALVDGMAEWVTEKYSIEAFFKDPSSTLKYLMQLGASEGSEEMASNWISRILYWAILGDEYDIPKRHDELIAKGYTEKQAFALICGDILGEDLEAGLSGMVSGVGMGAPRAAGYQAGKFLDSRGQKKYEGRVNGRLQETAVGFNEALPEDRRADLSAAGTGEQQYAAVRKSYEDYIKVLQEARANSPTQADIVQRRAQEIRKKLAEGSIDAKTAEDLAIDLAIDSGYDVEMMDSAEDMLDYIETMAANAGAQDPREQQIRDLQGQLREMDRAQILAMVEAGNEERRDEKRGTATKATGIRPAAVDTTDAQKAGTPKRPGLRERRALEKQSIQEDRRKQREAEQLQRDTARAERDMQQRMEDKEDNRSFLEYTRAIDSVYGEGEKSEARTQAEAAAAKRDKSLASHAEYSDTGEQMTVEGVRVTSNGSILLEVRGEDGDVIQLPDRHITIKDEDLSRIISVAAGYGAGANGIYQAWYGSGDSVDDFAAGLKLADLYMQNGWTVDQAVQKGQRYGVPETTMRAAYEARTQEETAGTAGAEQQAGGEQQEFTQEELETAYDAQATKEAEEEQTTAGAEQAAPETSGSEAEAEQAEPETSGTGEKAEQETPKTEQKRGTAEQATPKTAGSKAGTQATDTRNGVTGAVDSVRVTSDGDVVLGIRENGEVVEVTKADVDITDQGLPDLITVAAEYGPAANAVYQGYFASGDTVNNYVSGLRLADLYGRTNMTMEQAVERGTQYGLPETTVRTGYLAGKAARSSQQATDARTTAAQHERALKGLTGDTTSNIEEVIKTNPGISKARAQMMTAADSLIRSLGMNVEWYASDVNENGLRTADNGSYHAGTNTIALDAYAGSNTADTSQVQIYSAMMHELTHAARAWAGKNTWNSYKDFVLSQSRMNDAAFEEEVEHRVAAYMKEGRSREDAIDLAEEEIVADASAKVELTEDTLRELASKDMNLFERIVKKIGEMFDRIVDMFRDMRENGEMNRDAARMLDVAEQHRDMWNKMVLEVRENIQKTIAEGRSSAVVDEAVENGEAISPVEEEKYSRRHDAEYMDAAMKKNGKTGNVTDEDMRQAAQDRAKIKAILDARQDEWMLPNDVEGNTWYSDSAYGGSQELSTVCPRSLANERLMDIVAKQLGRPLTVADTLVISQEMATLMGDMAECFYCYVATDRRAYREYLGEYLKQRDAIIEDLKTDKGGRKGELYKKYLNKRKDTDNMYSRFRMWQEIARNGYRMIGESELSDISALEKNMHDMTGKVLDIAADRFGVPAGDIEIKGNNVQRKGSGPVAQRRLGTLTQLRTGENADTVYRYMQLRDAIDYAQAASWQKKRTGYTAYNGHILNWSKSLIDKLNSMYGMRMYSFSDYSPAYLLENMQMITDASVQGLKVLGYTKDINFAEIFAPSGMNINVSCFAYQDAKGNIAMDGMMGADWARAQALRNNHRNVGVVMVATNDAIVEWAMKQDWIDVVIPYHLVRTGAKVAEYFNYTNYTDISEDKWEKGATHPKKQKAGVYPTEHNNDVVQYADALIEKGQRPRFEKWFPEFAQYKAGEITAEELRARVEESGYMKLVNECRLSAAESQAVQPIFDMAAAEQDLRDYRGYGRPVGGTLESEAYFADEIAEKVQENEGVRKSERNAEYMAAVEKGDTETADRHVFFQPDQVKSADTVTYEDNGDRIPLDERFRVKEEDIRHSVREALGRKIAWIDNNVLLDKDPKDTDIQAARKYLKSKVGNIEKIIETGDTVYIGDDLPNEYAKGESSWILKKKYQRILRAKMHAVDGINDMIKVATNERWEPTEHIKNKDAKYGMYRFDTIFAFPIYDRLSHEVTNVKAYECEMVVRHASNNKWYVYDIVKIKGAPKYANALLGSTESVGGDAARRYGGSSTSTISQTNDRSQGQNGNRSSQRVPYRLSDNEVLSQADRIRGESQQENEVLDRYRQEQDNVRQLRGEMENVGSQLDSAIASGKGEAYQKLLDEKRRLEKKIGRKGARLSEQEAAHYREALDRIGMYQRKIDQNNTAIEAAEKAGNTMEARQLERQNEALTRSIGFEKQTVDAYGGETNEKAQARLDEVNRQIAEMQKDPDVKAIDKLKTDIRNLRRAIAGANDRMRAMQQSTALKGVIDRERQKILTNLGVGYGSEAEEYARNINTAQRREENRQAIVSIVKKLTTTINEGQKKNQVPDQIKKLLIPYLEKIDVTSGRNTTDDKKMTQAMRKMADVLSEVEQAQASDGELGEGIADLAGWLQMPEGYANAFHKLVSRIEEATRKEGGVVRNMSADDMQALADNLRMIQTQVSRANKFLENNRFRSAQDASHQTIEEMREIRARTQTNKIAQAARDFLGWTNATPYYAFKRMGPAAQAMFTELMDGWDALDKHVDEIMAFRATAYNDAEVRAWGKETHELKLESGKTVRLTTAQAMSLYCLSMRPSAMQHLLKGGIRIADFGPRMNRTTQNENFLVTSKDVKAIKDVLTDRQLEVAQKLQNFMSDECAKWGNRVTMSMYGIRFFGEKFYFPMKTVEESHSISAGDSTPSIYKLMNQSFMNRLNPNASAALVVDDIFDVFTDHTANMAKMDSLGMPLMDLMKWYGFRETHYDPKTGQREDVTVRTALKQAFGPAAGDYIMTLVKDINGTTETSREYGSAAGLMSKSKVASVGGNLRVLIQQPTSYFRAGAMISWKYLAKAMTTRLTGQVKKAMDLCPIAGWKSKGYYDTGIQRSMRSLIKSEGSKLDRINELLMAPAGKADELTWGRLFTAVELETEDRAARGEITVEKGSDAWNKIINDRFREIIYATQVVDSTLTRSQIMRGKGLHNKAMTAFMAEPTLTMNMLTNLVSDVVLDVRKGMSSSEIRQRNLPKIARVGAAVLMSKIAVVLAQSLADAFRDDDDYETFREKALAALKKNGIDEAILPKQIPFIKDIWGALAGETSSDLTGAVFTEGRALGETLVKLLSGQGTGSRTAWGVIYQSMRVFDRVAGTSSANVARDTIAIWNTASTALGWDLKLQTYKDKDAKGIDALYAAVMSGDEKRIAELQKELELNGVDPDKVESGMSSRITKRYLGDDMDEEEAREALGAYAGFSGDKLDDKIAHANYQKETGLKWSEMKSDFLAQKLTRDEAIGYLKKYGGKSADDAYWMVVGWDGRGKYDRLDEALISGTGVEDAIQELRDHGVEEKTVKSSITRGIHDAYDDGDMTGAHAVKMLVKYGGKTQEQAEKTVQGWRNK